MLPCLHISFWAAIKRKHHKGTIEPLWKGGDAHSWKSVLTRCCYQRNLACFNNQSASTCIPQVPRNCFHRESRKGPAFLGRPGLKGFMKPLHMKQTVASLEATGTKEYWCSHQQRLGRAPSAAGIPELSPSTQNETEPALQGSPLRAGTTQFCPRALHTLGVTGCLVTFYRHTEITTDIPGAHVHISPQMSTGIH